MIRHGKRQQPPTSASAFSRMSLTSPYEKLWTTVVDAAHYRSKLAWRVRPSKKILWDVIAVRFADLTIEDTLARLIVAQQQRPPSVEPSYAEAAISANFAEALAVEFYARKPLSLQEIDRIRQLGKAQETIADTFYAHLRFGRVAAIATGVAALVALPKETIDWFGWNYGVFRAVLLLGTLLALGLTYAVSFWPGQLAARRARQKRLFDAVLVYLESLASEEEDGTASPPTQA
jgi:hypothetical protein